jgi:hypothetical protein
MPEVTATTACVLNFTMSASFARAAEVMAKAEEAYASAREWSQDRIEVAVAD